MNGALRAWTDRVLRWIYPADTMCPLCRAERLAEDWLCLACKKKFPWVCAPLCPLCGRPVDAAGYCADCGRAERIFDKGVALAVYRGEAKRAVLDLKYHGARWHAPWMGETMGERVRSEEMTPEAVIPVPLHPHKERRRGYNQSGLLAEAAARYLGLPLWDDVLTRRKDTPTQTRLNREARLTNMRDAFEVISGERIAGREVLLADDIMTTGATLESCAACLKRNGAIKVNTVVFAIGARITNTQ